MRVLWPFPPLYWGYKQPPNPVGMIFRTWAQLNATAECHTMASIWLGGQSWPTEDKENMPRKKEIKLLVLTLESLGNLQVIEFAFPTLDEKVKLRFLPTVG